MGGLYLQYIHIWTDEAMTGSQSVGRSNYPPAVQDCFGAAVWFRLMLLVVGHSFTVSTWMWSGGDPGGARLRDLWNV